MGDSGAEDEARSSDWRDAIQGTNGLCRQAAQGWRSPSLVGRVPDLLCQDGPPGWHRTHHAGPDQGYVEGYGGLKLWTPGFKRNLHGRSSSYGRLSADVCWNSDAQACTVCLGRDQRSTDALRLRDLRCPTLY